MKVHRITFTPSGRSLPVPEGDTILDAARRASETLPAECGGRGACGRCLVRVVEGEVPEYRVLHRTEGRPEVLACLTPIRGPLTVLPLVDAELPHLISRDQNIGVRPLEEWAPWTLPLDPLGDRVNDADLGVALDVGTTTLRLALVRLSDGAIVGEAGAYNPQIGRGADVISRIVAAEKGLLDELASLVRGAVDQILATASAAAKVDPGRIRAYMVAGNTTMVHLLLAEDPSGIRRVPSEPRVLAFSPVAAAAIGWPGTGRARVHTMPAAGGWVGGDIVVGVVRAGVPRAGQPLTLYVDLGTNGEIVLGNADFALACACSAGPAFEGGGIRCGMRADRGAIDGARVDPAGETLDLSVIGGGRAEGVCGSGLIALVQGLFAAGWIDRSGRFTERLPHRYRVNGPSGAAVALEPRGQVALWERDIASLVRAKAAIFAGIRSLTSVLGKGAGPLQRVVVSGNFGRYLNLAAATGIGLLPDLPFGCYEYIDNGSLEGAALALLSRPFLSDIDAYLGRMTYVDLSTVPGYMDEFIGASFLPHTSPELLRL
jgi:uncharacterized 2Fe-2S/4Fe-4S cluster protein (DUF4445 family)